MNKVEDSNSPLPTGSSHPSSQSSTQRKSKISNENPLQPIMQIEDSSSPLPTNTSLEVISQPKLKISDENLPQLINQVEDSNSPLPTESFNVSSRSSSQPKSQQINQIKYSSSSLPTGSSNVSSRSSSQRKLKISDENLPQNKKFKENSSPPIIQIEDSEESYQIGSSKMINSSGSILSDGEEDSSMNSTIIQTQNKPSLPSIFLPGCVYKPLVDPPTIQDVLDSMDQYGIPSTDNGAPF